MVDEEQRRDPPSASSVSREASSLTSLLTGGSDFHRQNRLGVPSASSNAISASVPHVNRVDGGFNAGLSSSAGPAVSTSLPAQAQPPPPQPPPTRLCNPTKLFCQKQQERTCQNGGSDSDLHRRLSVEQQQLQQQQHQQQRQSTDGSRTGSPAVAGDNYLNVRPRLGPRHHQSPRQSGSPATRLGEGSLGGVSPGNDADVCGSTVSSVSELDDLFEDIAEGTLEKADPEEVDAITGLLKSSMTMPHSNSLSDITPK